jgi:two-component system nitrate/nitrite response regulator NarL
MSPQDTIASSPRPDLVRLVVADTRPIFRDGLRQLLQAEPRLSIVGETGDHAAVLGLVQTLQPQILLLEFSQSAFEILEAIAASGSSTRSIILADSVDGADLTKALHLGARGLVLKDSAADVLFKCIDSVVAGRYWIASGDVPDMRAGLRQLDAELRRRRAFGLTPRELEIVRMIVAGCTNKEIAEQLSIGENTVKSHLTHIFNKLGASTRIELALFAAHHRLLDGV